jgi:hypothetical protein
MMTVGIGIRYKHFRYSICSLKDKYRGQHFEIFAPAIADKGGICNPKVCGFSPMMADAKNLAT